MSVLYTLDSSGSQPVPARSTAGAVNISEVMTVQGSPQVVAIGAAGAQSAAVQPTTNRVALCATSACWVAVGSNPTAAANAAGSIYVPANIPFPPISVTPGVTKIAAIQASAAGYLSIVEIL